jgi:glutamate-1-semialdehyde 2,1-aminomutase
VSSVTSLDPSRTRQLLERERATHETRNPSSRALFDGAGHLFGRVPMTWMNKWAGGFPLYQAGASGNRITDVDGNSYVDFALGDTAAMAGHCPAATVAAVQERIAVSGGITTMLPTEDAEWVAAELTRRFGLPLWSYTLTATDGNRWAIRLARLVTGRSKVLTFSYCYHGSVDETFAVLGADGTTLTRPGNVGEPVPVGVTTRAAEFNDLASVERALAHGDVAVIVMEPALTNIGIVLPEPGFLAGVRELATARGALLLIDETHTISAGPGGCTAAWGLQPDIFVIGKSIGGGIPTGAYGITQAIADQVAAHPDADLVDVGGIGGTLAGNALSTAAMRATLGEVLTDEAFARMIELATGFTAGVQATIDGHDLPWSISQLGARAEYTFARPAPRTGTEASTSGDEVLAEYLHLFAQNRGVLITPFHNMALMCPATVADDVDRHTAVFAEAVDHLLSAS